MPEETSEQKKISETLSYENKALENIGDLPFADRAASFKAQHLIEREKKYFEHIIKANYSQMLLPIKISTLEDAVNKLVAVEEELKPLADSHKKVDREKKAALMVKYETAKALVEAEETKVETMEQIIAACKGKAEEELLYMDYVAKNF